VHELVERVLGRPVDRSITDRIHRRTGGHPFFVREVALLAHHTGVTLERIPAAVGDLIERRIRRLPGPTQAVLEVAAVIGMELLADVVAGALGISTLTVEVASRDAVAAGVLSPTDDGLVFTHDLLRETILDRLGGAAASCLAPGDRRCPRGPRGTSGPGGAGRAGSALHRRRFP
jgi:predicted ATPase